MSPILATVIPAIRASVGSWMMLAGPRQCRAAVRLSTMAGSRVGIGVCATAVPMGAPRASARTTRRRFPIVLSDTLLATVAAAVLSLAYTMPVVAIDACHPTVFP
jgi:hypothetical protein